MNVQKVAKIGPRDPNPPSKVVFERGPIWPHLTPIVHIKSEYSRIVLHI